MFFILKAFAESDTTDITKGAFSINLSEYFSWLIPNMQRPTISGIIDNIVKIFFNLSGTIAILIVVYGGIMLLFSSTNEANRKKSMTIIINGIIGFVLVLLTYYIVLFVTFIIGEITT